jgi:hypothetical protein
VSGSEAAPPEDAPLEAAEQIARVLAELERGLGRAIKRELADEQNELLDAVRRDSSTKSVDDVLPPVEQHVERLVNAAAPVLSDVATAGAVSLPAERRSSNEPPRVGALARDVAAEVAVDLVTSLRERLATAFAQPTDDDEDAASEAVRAAYRELRGQRVDPAGAHAVLVAFNRGVLDAAASGTVVGWLATESMGGCPTCEGNVAATAVVAGEPFPSGDIAPPSHPGCRCVLVEMPADGRGGAADRSRQ